MRASSISSSATAAVATLPFFSTDDTSVMARVCVGGPAGERGAGGGVWVVVDELQPLSRREGARARGHIYPVEGDNARPGKRRSESAGRDTASFLIADQIWPLGYL